MPNQAFNPASSDLHLDLFQTIAEHRRVLRRYFALFEEEVGVHRDLARSIKAIREAALQYPQIPAFTAKKAG